MLLEFLKKKALVIMNLQNKKISIKYFAIALFIFTHANSQENIIKINGVVKSDSTFLRDINIINKTKNFGASSNQKGAYELYAALGDTILFSSVSYNERIIVISKNHLLKKSITVYLEPKVNELEEVLIEKRINENWTKYAVQNGRVLEKDAMEYNKAPNALNLTDPTSPAGSNTGNVLGVLSLLSEKIFASSIKNRKERNIIKQQTQLLKESFSEKLYTSYGKSYFIDQLNIDDYKVYLFLDYCIDNGLNSYYDKHEIEIKNFLFIQSKKFNELNY